MARCKHLIFTEADQQIDNLIGHKLVSAVKSRGSVIVARFGVNKTTLKKILAKHLRG